MQHKACCRYIVRTDCHALFLERQISIEHETVELRLLQGDLVPLSALVLYRHIAFQMLIKSQLQWLKKTRAFADADLGRTQPQRAGIDFGIVLGSRRMRPNELFDKLFVRHRLDLRAKGD